MEAALASEAHALAPEKGGGGRQQPAAEARALAQEKGGPETPAAADRCRICWQGGAAEPLLEDLCRCRGSLRHCHARCWIKWSLHRPSRRRWTCELCGGRVAAHLGAERALALVTLLAKAERELRAARAPQPPRHRRAPAAALAARFRAAFTSLLL
jgi:hypothetical protein